MIIEELGCAYAEVFSGVSVILVDSWSAIFPLISLVFYTRKHFHDSEVRLLY